MQGGRGLRNLLPRFATSRGLSTAPVTATVVRCHAFNGEAHKAIKVEQEQLSAPSKSQVMLKFLAAPINPHDLNKLEGMAGAMTAPFVPGSEGVAEVIATGSDVKGLAVGDRVISISDIGTWRTHAVCNSSDVMKVSSSLAVQYAASTLSPCAALSMLNDIVSLQKGDTIIQNGANSTVGQAVIQLAKAKGINTINVLRARPDPQNQQTIEYLKSLGGTVVLDDQTLNKRPEVAQLISDLPAPKLALNCQGALSATEMARLLATGGTMVTYGNMGGKGLLIPSSKFFAGDLKLCGFNMAAKSAVERSSAVEQVSKMFESSALKMGLEEVPFAKVEDAIINSQKEWKEKKLVLTM